MTIIRRLCGTAAALCTATAASALPGPVQQPTGRVVASTVGGFNSQPLGPTGASRTSAGALNGLGTASASAEIVLQPLPVLDVRGEKTGFASADGLATLNYQLVVRQYLPINPTVLPIPVLYSALLSTSVTGDSRLSNASAQLFITDEQQLLGNRHLYTVCTSGASCLGLIPTGIDPVPGRQEITGSFEVPYDDAVTVNIVAQVFTVADNGNAVQTRAFVDPVFRIDPVFLAAHPGLTIELSPGVGNNAPVPEPPVWALLALGLLGLHQRSSARSQCSGSPAASSPAAAAPATAG